MNRLTEAELNRALVFDAVLLPDHLDLMSAHGADHTVVLVMQNRHVWRLVNAHRDTLKQLPAESLKPSLKQLLHDDYRERIASGSPTTTLSDYLTFASAFYLGCGDMASAQCRQLVADMQYQLSDESATSASPDEFAASLRAAFHQLAAAITGLERFGYVNDALTHQSTLKSLIEQVSSFANTEDGELTPIATVAASIRALTQVSATKLTAGLISPSTLMVRLRATD